MKKISILALTILFINIQATSQITKGIWLVGGNASFASINYKSDAGSKSVGFDLKITPNLGYFIADKVATGVKTAIGKSGFRAEGTSSSSTYTDFNLGNTFAFSTGPAVYFNSSIGLEFLIGYSAYKNAGFEGTNSTVQFTLGLQAHLERDN